MHVGLSFFYLFILYTTTTSSPLPPPAKSSRLVQGDLKNYAPKILSIQPEDMEQRESRADNPVLFWSAGE